MVLIEIIINCILIINLKKVKIQKVITNKKVDL